MKLLLRVVLFLSSASFAVAAESQPEASTESALSILQKGGMAMYPLVALSIVTLILIFLYFLTIRRNSVVSDKFMNAAEALIRKRDYLGLVAQCNRQNDSISYVAEKALDFMTKNSGVSFAEVREVAEAEGSRQAGILTQRISYLSDIGSIAPMIGLLGTVIGMIKAFLTLSNGTSQGVKQLVLAENVSEALITTATGLVIGIVAMVFYSVFRGKVQKYIAELEAAATHLMALLAAQYKRSGGQTPSPVYSQSYPQEAAYAEAPPHGPSPSQPPSAPAPLEETNRDIRGI